MPVLEVSEKTYNRILDDLKSEERKKGTLAKYSGRWKDVPDKKVEEVKKRLRKMRNESREKVS